VEVKTLTSSLGFDDHFIITASLEPSEKGLIITIVFENKRIARNQFTPNIEIWFPIEGYLSYAQKVYKTETITIIDHIYDLGDLRTRRKKYDYLISPGNSTVAYFYCKVPLEHLERMREISEKEGLVTLFLHLYFSGLYKARSLSQKTYKYHSIFEFKVSKATIEDWISQWTTFYAQYEDLPPAVPKEVLSDYIEAIKSFNVGAYKASVAMARRALQQALEDKGATKRARLLEQIDELKSKGILDKATSSLAHGIRQFGNYGAHPQTDLLAQVTPDDTKLVINVLKKIIKQLYATN